MLNTPSHVTYGLLYSLTLLPPSQHNILNFKFLMFFSEIKYLQLPSELLMKIKDKIIEKFMASQNLLDYFGIQ